MNKADPYKPLKVDARTQYAQSIGGRQSIASPSKVLGPERRLLKRLLAAIGHPSITVSLWDGQTVYQPNRPPVAHLAILDRRTLWRLLATPELAFGDGYVGGTIAVDGDLVELNVAVNRARQAAGSRRAQLERALRGLLLRPHGNSLRDSRKNIYHHYDIGNDFYRLWLDQEMVYTCAYFPTSTATLEQAQIAKMEHVCRKLQLAPDQTVVEAGCGWGALARYMARNHGVRVRAFNISHEQIAYARARAKTEGLAGRVEFIEDDYRNITGEYDAVVSVGMLEHVGADHYAEFGRIIRRSLKPQGLSLIHTIGRNRARVNSPWIERRIFPGSYPPSLREMMEVFEPNQLSVLDVENLRLHYAKTLRHWLERFEQAMDKLSENYDERFVRAWRLYLAGSIAAFLTGSLQLFQVLCTHADNNRIPWTRTHIYVSRERQRAPHDEVAT